MMISKYLFPDIKHNSINDIDVELLAKKGIKFAILDIDNTLVPYTSPKPDQNALAFLGKLKANGIDYCFVSNNSGKRIDIFNEEISAPAFSKAGKPLLFGINKAMELLGAKTGNTMLIGDQVFTDIFGGKRAKILTILVDPIKEVDTLFFRFKRYFERKIIKSYENSKRGNNK